MDVSELTRTGRHHTRAQRLSRVKRQLNWVLRTGSAIQSPEKQNPTEFSLGSKKGFIILWGVTQTPALSLAFLEHPVCSRILATWDKQIGIISLPSSWGSYHWLSFMRWHWQYSSHRQKQTVESVHPWCRVWRRLAWLLLLIKGSTGWCPDGSCHAKSKLPNHLKRHKNFSLSPYLETPRNTYKLKKDQHDQEVRQ